jgi:hypothetical protein
VIIYGANFITVLAELPQIILTIGKIGSTFARLSPLYQLYK